MDIKRTLLWVIFVVSLLMLYGNWQRSHGPVTTATQNNETTIAQVGKAKTNSDLPTEAHSASPTSNAIPGVNKDGGAETKVVGEKITITTDVLRAQIDTVGGNLVRLELLKHLDHNGQPVVLFQQDAIHTYMARTGLVGQTELPNHHTVFRLISREHELSPNKNEFSVSLEAEKNGVALTKTYTFKRGSYVIDSHFALANHTDHTVTPTLYLELLRDGSKIDASHFYSTFTGPAVYTGNEKFKKIEFSDLDKGKAKYPTLANSGESAWVSMVQHYFASVWIPNDQQKREIYVEKLDANLYRTGFKQQIPSISAGGKVTVDARLFAGPQEEPLLESLAPGLELVKDYGWLAIIAKPLFWLLEKIHSILGNWGWAIVALTVLLKLVFFPLSAASYKSMARMKELQPRIKTLRERYKDEPQKMNQAMMELYRNEKINPLGGCFPILIQIPVFIALYWVLLASVEMRNAPWIGWIHDLSAPDPYYVLPILMAVSMFIQTKLNPTPPDPLQAKIMMFMPLAFSVMFFFFPSGLVLYWVVNNILSIAQQWQIARMHGAKPSKAA